MTSDSSGLVRGLSVFGAYSVVVGTVIGTGVFLKARVMTCNVETPWMVLAVWVAAGLLSVAGTLTYAELAAMMPEAGGEYVYIREAYGRGAGFLYGWTQFVIVYTGSAAAKGVGFALFLNVLTGGALDVNYFTIPILGRELFFGRLQIVALAIVSIVTLINFASVAMSGRVAWLLTVLKMALLLAVGVGAFWVAPGDWSHFSMSGQAGTCEAVAPGARGGIFGFFAAMLGALWAYDGWANLTVVSGEVKNPQRNLPIALIGGIASAMLLYVFVNAAYFYVLAPAEVASVSLSSSVATDVAKSFLGEAAVKAMAAMLIVSTLGSLFTGILTGARIPYAMSRDRMFFPSLGRVSNKTHVPIPALIVQWVWVCILALSGSFDTLTDYAIFAAWIFYGLATTSVFVFRKRNPDAPRAYRTIGYPYVPLIFIGVTICLLLNTIWTAPLQSAIGLGIILLGLPLYRYFRNKR